MKLSTLGERAIIRKISGLLDIGDDAAYFKVGDKYLVLSTDAIYADTHILPGMSFEQVGKFIVSVNLSDVAAMGAKPFAFLLAYVGPDIDFNDFDAIIRGAEKQCKKYGVEYAGGDTKYASGLTLVGSSAGFVKKPVLRTGAQVGDVVAVTGSLGKASFGVDCILNNRRCPKKIISASMEPKPRIREGMFLSKYASAMTDISDSLSVSLHNLAVEVGIVLNVDDIPVDKDIMRLSSVFGVNYLDYVLYGGGDYELLFTTSPEAFNIIEKKIDASVIGEVVKSHGVTEVIDNRRIPLPQRGFEHFRF